MLPRLLLTALLSISPALALWPQPQKLSTGSTPLRLSSGFSISISGVHNAPQDLTDTVQRTSNFLRNDKLQALVPDRGASSEKAIKGAKELKSLTVSYTGKGTIKSISEEAIADVESRVESYTLTIPADGSSAVLKANSSLGLLRGLTTFGQLWYDWQGTTYTLQAPFSITDAPAYPYRGFMLDTARNFFSVADIKRTLDAMSWVKLNTFHWHVVDSQSFPLVVPGFTELSAKGAYSSDQVYTTNDVKDIVQYAAARGIDVLPEIDTPGHTSVIAKAHPEHIACFEASPWAQFANEPPAGQLRLASAATTKFTAGLVKAAASLFPSKLFSTGGDELNQNCYTQDSATQNDLKQQGKTLDQALDTFTQATHAALKSVGKRAVVWQEMVIDHPVTLANDTVVMVWISSADAATVAQKGFKFVHAASDYFYLDCGAGGWVGQNPLGNSWCDPFKTWQKSYSFDPLANLTTEQSKLVLGGQHLLWTEQSGPSNLDPITWPRAASSAELFWSGAGGDVGKALPRLHDLSFRFRQRGIDTISLQPLWCAVRDGACDLEA